MSDRATLMVRRCRPCQGAGVVEDAHCRLCLVRIADDDPWWESDDETMPCGHNEENLIETITCPECGGAGRSEQWLSPVEVKAIQRGKVARITFVAGLSLILLVVLAIVIYTSPRSQFCCGGLGIGAPPLAYMAYYLRPS